MDPCPFVRVTVGNLALKIPAAAKPARSAVHPSSSPCFCLIKLKGFPPQTAVVPYIPPENTPFPDANSLTHAASFHLSKSDLDKLTGRSSLFSTSSKPCLKISVYSGRRGPACALSSGRLLGKISVPLDLTTAESRAVIFHNGWINVGKETKCVAQFHLNVKAEPDPRFVFQFDGEPECSPQIFQIRGNIRQPVFTCKFSFRAADRNQRSRSLPPEHSNGARGWLSSFGSERERQGKERKGWSITIHDLSGSPVAVASMVTPFVASPGSDRVSRSNPGCWLILRPGDSTWKPWGRLEAWRECGTADGLGYRFELIPDSAATAGIVLAESTLSCSKGGKFMIDLIGNSNSSPAKVNGRTTPSSTTASPVCSPRSSGDFGYGLWPYCMYRGRGGARNLNYLGLALSSTNTNRQWNMRNRCAVSKISASGFFFEVNGVSSSANNIGNDMREYGRKSPSLNSLFAYLRAIYTCRDVIQLFLSRFFRNPPIFLLCGPSFFWTI